MLFTFTRYMVKIMYFYKKNMIQKIRTSFIILLLITGISCEKPEDNSIPYEISINNFIWKGLNEYYLWQADVPVLSDTYFPNQNSLNNYLKNNNKTPNDFFESLLYRRNDIDRFSFIIEDYEILEQLISGTSATNGIDYQLVQKNSSSNAVYGWVRYVLPNSDAANKGVKRGDLFYAINNTPITTTNFRSLLNPDTYTIEFADFNDGAITPNQKSISLSKTTFAENPVHLTKIIEQENKKIGYLVYNGFYNEYDQQLNDVFGVLKAGGVTDLVLDLRYNGGGSINSSLLLGSLITGQFTGQLFAKEQWNSKGEAYFKDNSPESLNLNFINSINNVALNSLNLTKVYVLTTDDTASASELLINSLSPYINVVQVGNTTYGKNVGSITLYDSVNFSKSSRTSKSSRYAMQPIVLKTVNKVGFGEYEMGLIPSVFYKENIANLGQLGDTTEPLLSLAIQDITGNVINARKTTKQYNFISISNSKNIHPLQSEMYLDNLPTRVLNSIR